MPNSQEALLPTKVKTEKTGMIRMLRSDIGVWKKSFNLRFKKLVHPFKKVTQEKRREDGMIRSLRDGFKIDLLSFYVT